VQQLLSRDMDFELDEEDDTTPAHIASAFRTQLGTPLYDDARLVSVPLSAALTRCRRRLRRSASDRFLKVGAAADALPDVAYTSPTKPPTTDLPFSCTGSSATRWRASRPSPGRAREAELGENGYRLEVADRGRDQLQKLTLHLYGGATDALNLHIPNRVG